MAKTSFERMSYAELLKFHERLKNAIAQLRIIEAATTKELERVEAVRLRGKVKPFGRGHPRRLREAKYHNSKDPSQTLRGRGRRPK